MVNSGLLLVGLRAIFFPMQIPTPDKIARFGGLGIAASTGAVGPSSLERWPWESPQHDPAEARRLI
jgi:hypothetical protein